MMGMELMLKSMIKGLGIDPEAFANSIQMMQDAAVNAGHSLAEIEARQVRVEIMLLAICRHLELNPARHVPTLEIDDERNGKEAAGN